MTDTPAMAVDTSAVAKRKHSAAEPADTELVNRLVDEARAAAQYVLYVCSAASPAGQPPYSSPHEGATKCV